MQTSVRQKRGLVLNPRSAGCRMSECKTQCNSVQMQRREGEEYEG